LPLACPRRQAQQGAARPKRAAPCEPRKSRPATLGLLVALLAALVVSGCASTKSTKEASTTTARLHNAIPVPPPTNLTAGEKIKVSSQRLHSVGWQVSCMGKGKRVNAEAVRGQVTGTGLIAGFRGGTPSIWVAHNSDGSIIVSCR
jgi:hypothetical protein